ncbi:MAG: hypothetical protein A2913_00335 [Parcubacteria group bacterium RIFCSPLOWO2_01_FULL_40_65]|nr:MAG: hypothetical protein A2913_00335 [Parcubacteria group bacterium RIFCSPLOWO2_01_FULL_40_65]
MNPKFSLRSDWADKLLAMAETDKDKSAQSVSAFVLESQDKIRAIQTKLQRLLDGYLEQDIEREIYHEQKAILLSEKKSLDEKMARIEQKQNDWLEPFRNWIKVVLTLVKIARDSNLQEKKVAAKEIFGSHLLLGEKTVRACAPEILNSLAIPPKNPWSALCAVRLYPSKKPLSSLLVYLYNKARTYFETASLRSAETLGRRGQEGLRGGMPAPPSLPKNF